VVPEEKHYSVSRIFKKAEDKEKSLSTERETIKYQLP
jgi:hypothetical protein